MNTVSRAVAQSMSSRRFLLRLQSSCSAFSSAATEANPFTTSKQKAPPFPSSSNWPKPRQIPFQPKVANSVNLIGYISQPIQFKSSSDDKHSAATALTHHLSSDSHLWIPIIFEGDLAHVAACHIKENDHVHIIGQLSANSSPIDVIGTQSKVQIYVQNINFVEGSSHTTKHHGYGQEILSTQLIEGPLKDSAAMSKNGSFVLKNWHDLIDNPKEWWDYRGSKLNGTANPKHPDFKRKDGGLVMWLDRAPAWALSELETLHFDVQMARSKQAKLAKGEESWKQLVENPGKWWDNRENKRNVKGPDFKHKETGEGLWLNDSPTWVLSKLPPLKSERNVITS
ncbi:protein OSB3, chloroplastic/mitochondrial-like [Euphorbia lathyris]|uniref:protein OSB3, chloroplastic/mitochondrial-like n=1 Tax=Euphorbia lathyris TaxID=212925 RepID=UPI0033137D3E